MKKILCLLLVVALSACTSIVKVEGEQVVNSRLSVRVTEAWNKIAPPGSQQPYELWTQEGVTLDQLRIWVAVRPQQALVMAPVKAGAAPGAKPARVPTFEAGMQPDQLVSLFEAVYSIDGSMVQMTRIEPDTFAGQRGVRFEFSVTRKEDDVQLSGIGWVAVRNNELFAATFVAPRLYFYGRLQPKAETVIRTAQIKG